MNRSPPCPPAGFAAKYRGMYTWRKGVRAKGTCPKPPTPEAGPEDAGARAESPDALPRPCAPVPAAVARAGLLFGPHGVRLEKPAHRGLRGSELERRVLRLLRPLPSRRRTRSKGR